MAAMEAASEQSAKLPSAGSTPAAASWYAVWPAWLWIEMSEMWLSVRLKLNDEMVDESALKADDENRKGSSPS